MKKLAKSMFCLLLVLILTIPSTMSVKASATSKYYYVKNGALAAYKNQKTLVVVETIKDDDYSRFITKLPVMKNVTKVIFKNETSNYPEDLFTKCPNVKEVEIRKYVDIDPLRFRELSKLKHLNTIKVQSGSRNYISKDGVLYAYNEVDPESDAVPKADTLIAYPKAKKNTSYTMPSIVTNGFDNMGSNPYLKKVIFSKSYTSSNDDNYVMKNTLPNLESIAVAAGNTYLKAKDGVLFNDSMTKPLLYPNGKKDKVYSVPTSVTKIACCFGANKYMRTLKLGSKVSEFSWDGSCLPNLVDIKVASGNKKLANYNGTLFSADYKTLLYCAKGKTKPYQVKASTEKISYSAFNHCKITSITFPEGLKEIQEYAFSNTAITKLTLPSTIKEIHPYCTEKMNSLTTVSLRSGNNLFYAKEGILYSNDDEIVIWPAKRYIKKRTINADNQNGTAYFGYREKDKYVETLVIGKDVTNISVFYGDCNRLKKIELSSANKSLHLYNGVLYNSDYSEIVLYPNRNPDTSIVLHKNLKKLSQYWFRGTNNTVDLTLPENLQEIETNYTSAYDNATCEAGKENEYADYEFYMQCYDWEDPNDRDESPAFRRSCFQNLKTIHISSNNKYFTCTANVLYSKDKTQLVWYPVNRTNTTYTLPSSVTKLNAQLREFKNLKKLTINTNVKSTIELLGAYSTSLESIVVPTANTQYASKDGVVYSKNMTKMLIYPNGKKNTSYTMPNTVTLARFNFNNTHLQTLTLSSKLAKVIRYPELLRERFDQKKYAIFGGFTKLKQVNGLNRQIVFSYWY